MNELQQSPAVAPQGKQDLFTLAPKSLAEAMEYAKLISQSGMVQPNYIGKPADILVAVQMGAEVGLPPTQALQNIAVINGRPSLWGDAVIAICRRSPICEYIKEWAEEGVAYCETKRSDESEPVLRSFSLEDAKTAQLLNKKGPWQQYPKRMLQMRARGFCLRDAYPDVLRGLRVVEEEKDREPELKEVNPISTPKAQTATAALTSRLKGRTSPAGPDETQKAALSLVLSAVDQATDLAALKQAIAEVKAGTSGLTEEQVAEVVEAYNVKGHELKTGEPEPSDCASDAPPGCDPETGEILDQ